jgi:predicted nucleic acid-binding protein
MVLTIDPSTLLPALFSPSGRRRKFLVLVGYAALSHYARTGPDDLDLMEHEAGASGGSVAGRSVEEIVAEAGARRAYLEEFLPGVTPDDLALAVSVPLLDELGRKAEDERWAKRLPSIRDRHAFARTQILALATNVVQVDLERLPEYTRDRKDDYLVQTALNANASFLISDDKGIAPDDESVVYTDPSSGRRVQAIQFTPFVSEHVESSIFELDKIDGADLARVHAILSKLQS